MSDEKISSANHHKLCMSYHHEVHVHEIELFCDLTCDEPKDSKNPNTQVLHKNHQNLRTHGNVNKLNDVVENATSFDGCV